MGVVVHARRRGDAVVYRLWSTIADGYLTEDLSEPQVRLALLQEYSPRERRYGVHVQDIDQRLARATNDAASAEQQWETERCGCGNFHHAYRAAVDGTCAACGELADALGHQRECAPPETP